MRFVLVKKKFETQKQKITANLGNSKNFWTEIKKINPTGKAISNSIGEANGAKDISKLFLEKYRSLYNSVPTDENELNSLRDVIDSNITEKIYIAPDIIIICIGKLKAGKDDGDIGFKSDHIINGTHRLYILLSLLYNLMFYHGHTPADLLKSTIVSIPKDNKKSLSSSDNYRGISLFNSLSKLFDHIILLKYNKQLQSSDMQFGYKENHSTTLCTLIYKKVIDHYINNDSTVYSCFLDASKAFDRVHYGKLFIILLSKNIPNIVVRLYFDSYMRQKACVSWNNIKTSYFSMSNGVKQGGVISSIFF